APVRLSNRTSRESIMVTREDIEAFLDRLNADGATYQEVEPGLWVVKPGGALDFDVVVTHNPPVVLLRVKVMPLPADAAESAALNRRLLELNATDLLHGAYGIDGDAVVLTEALELAHLDFEEFLASFESMTLSLTGHLRELAAFREAR
ncbi:YbjN domain-containing protein, partial [Gemmatimonas sp.]|uniref:YbjN domain-containing protein n=2 Tax=Gemmatimonas sp. TaxID=1962908 RepID=UPI00391DE9C8